MNKTFTRLGPIVGRLSHNSANIWAQAGRPNLMPKMDMTALYVTTPQVEFKLHYNEQGWKARTIKTIEPANLRSIITGL